MKQIILNINISNIKLLIRLSLLILNALKIL